MKNNMSSFFEDPEFKALLAKYEGMATSHTPTYFDADELIDLAEFYSAKGRYEDADKAIELGLQLHPNDVDILIFRARSLAMHGKLDEAHMVASLIEDEDDREVKFLLADLLIEGNRMEEADRILQELAEKENYELDTLLDILEEYIDVNQESYAQRWFLHIMQYQDLIKDPKKGLRLLDVLCYYHVAFNHPKQAVPFLQMLLDRKPYSDFHWVELGRCYIQLGQPNEAHEALDFALAINDKDEEAYMLKAFACKQANNFEEAISWFQKLVKMSEGNPRYIQFLARAYFDTEQYEKAWQLLQPFLEQPLQLSAFEKAEAYLTIALCCAHMERPYEEGLRYLQTALKLDQGASTYISAGHFYLAYGTEYNKQTDQVFELALSQATSKEERYDILMEISSACLSAQRFDYAAAYFEQIIINYPQSAPGLYFFMVYCYYFLRAKQPFMHYLAKMKKEVPEIYETMNQDKGLINDDEFYNFIKLIKNGVENGTINLDKYL